MTRKQALNEAINKLSKNKANKEICETLQLISNEIHLSHWSEEHIFDAFNQYINEHGYLPSKSEIDKELSLPSYSMVKYKFKMPLKEFYNKYYSKYTNLCQSSIYNKRPVSYWIEDFKNQYKNLNYPTMKNYDKNRKPNTPCAQHLIKLTNSKTWNNMLNEFDLVRPKGKTNLNIIAPSLDDLTFEQTEALLKRFLYIKETILDKVTERMQREGIKIGEKNKVE